MKRKIGFTIKNMPLAKKLFLFGLLFMELCVLVGAYASNGEAFQNLFYGSGGVDTFQDFYNALQAGRKPYEFGQLYPPFIFVILNFLKGMIPEAISEQGSLVIRDSQSGRMVYLLWMAVQMYLFAQLFRKLYDSTKPESETTSFPRELILFGILFSEPFLFLYERGNLIILALNCLMVFILWYNSENKWLRRIAFVSLAISAAIKIYPAIFGIVLLREKKWKQAIEAAILGLIFFFVPFLFMEGENRNLLTLFNTLSSAVQQYYDNTGFGYRHDLSNIFRILGAVCGRDLKLLGNLVTIILFIIGVVVVLFGKNLCRWEIYAMLSTIMILVTGSNYTYCIIFMVVPLIIFINTEAEGKTVGSYIYAILFLMMFMPIIINVNRDLIAPAIEPMWPGFPLNLLSLMESAALVALFIFLCIKGIRGLSPLRIK